MTVVWTGFYCNLISADRFANSSPFHLEKWGCCTPSSKSGGTGTPRTPMCVDVHGLYDCDAVTGVHVVLLFIHYSLLRWMAFTAAA